MGAHAQLAVMYHYVGDKQHPLTQRLCGLSTEAFVAQLDWLTERFEAAPLSPGKSDHHPASHGVVLTFDDGLIDHIESAAPLLEARGLRGVFLICGRPFVEGKMLAAHMVHLLAAAMGNESLCERVWQWLDQNTADIDWQARIDHTAANVLYHYEAPRLATVKYLLHMALPIDLRNAMLEELFAEHVGSQADWVQRTYGTIDHWRDIQARGHVIGGHGYAHEPLSTLFPADAGRDIRQCRAFLNEHLGDRPRPFSYPFGRYNEVSMRACQENGFTHAWTTMEHMNGARVRPYCLGRVDTIRVKQFLKNEIAA
jgi:peptidoglycan/xylan/chitin deacetylase (PgdA/CDA1 family)